MHDEVYDLIIYLKDKLFKFRKITPQNQTKLPAHNHMKTMN